MSRKILIQNGGVRAFVCDKLAAPLSGGGTAVFIPEDEADRYITTGVLTATENGTYHASADSLDGYSEVRVNVPENGGYLEGVDAADGRTYRVTVDGDGKIQKEEVGA